MYHRVLTVTQRGNAIIQAEGKFIPGIVKVEDSLYSIPSFFFLQSL